MNARELLPATATRVERASSPVVNSAIRQRTDAEIVRLERAPPESLQRRLDELDAEWDVERTLQLNASLVALLGVALARTVDRRILILPAAVFTFFAQHALQGWCPPVPLFRRLGVRTAREIARERYALKVLRGDFDDVPRAGDVSPEDRVRAVLAAVDR